MTILKLENFTIGNQEPMTLMGGVNVLESESIVMTVAEKFSKTTSNLNINWIFKGSFDKANRSSISSFRGPGLDEGLKMLEKVKSEFNVPVITDIHEPSQADPVSKVCDVIQIPAFLCRQTDLVIAAAKTQKIIQFKKPQFLSAPEMKNVIEKCYQAGNKKVTLCERGNSFGYNNLVVDMLNFQIMNVLVFFFKQKTAYEISECDWSSDVCSPISRRFFFFKQKTAYEISECDWSSDVCSSD